MPDEGKTLGRRMMQRIIRWREGFRETRMPASGRLIGDYLKGCAEELPEDCEKVVIQASNDTIAKKTETSIKTVQNNLRLMEEKQLIRRNPVGGRAGSSRTRSSCSYRRRRGTLWTKTRDKTRDHRPAQVPKRRAGALSRSGCTR
jgi:hypothetical protein